MMKKYSHKAELAKYPLNTYRNTTKSGVQAAWNQHTEWGQEYLKRCFRRKNYRTPRVQKVTVYGTIRNSFRKVFRAKISLSGATNPQAKLAGEIGRYLLKHLIILLLHSSNVTHAQYKENLCATSSSNVCYLRSLLAYCFPCNLFRCVV